MLPYEENIKKTTTTHEPLIRYISFRVHLAFIRVVSICVAEYIEVCMLPSEFWVFFSVSISLILHLVLLFAISIKVVSKTVLGDGVTAVWNPAGISPLPTMIESHFSISPSWSTDLNVSWEDKIILAMISHISSGRLSLWWKSLAFKYVLTYSLHNVVGVGYISGAVHVWEHLQLISFEM